MASSGTLNLLDKENVETVKLRASKPNDSLKSFTLAGMAAGMALSTITPYDGQISAYESRNTAFYATYAGEEIHMNSSIFEKTLNRVEKNLETRIGGLQESINGIREGVMQNGKDIREINKNLPEYLKESALPEAIESISNKKFVNKIKFIGGHLITVILTLLCAFVAFKFGWA